MSTSKLEKRKRSKRRKIQKSKPSLEVHFPPNGIISMLIAVAEVYPKEAFGTVYGKRVGDRFLVKGVVPYQLVNRTRSSVELDDKHFAVMNRILCSLERYKQVGLWHSHPYGQSQKCNATPSQLDIETTDSESLEIIIALRPAKKKTRWHYSTWSKTLTGTFDKYYVRIRAFYKPHENAQRLRRCEISTDYQGL